MCTIGTGVNELSLTRFHPHTRRFHWTTGLHVYALSPCCLLIFIGANQLPSGPVYDIKKPISWRLQKNIAISSFYFKRCHHHIHGGFIIPLLSWINLVMPDVLPSVSSQRQYRCKKKIVTFTFTSNIAIPGIAISNPNE